jgi:subfamily B ATP-binding cassette protein MsbA
VGPEAAWRVRAIAVKDRMMRFLDERVLSRFRDPAPDGQPPDTERSALRRFVHDWILPRWRELAVSIAVGFGLALATTGYPVVIKHAFDTLGAGKFEALAYVLTAIVVITAMRGLFLYLHQITSNRVILRLGADLQRRVFSHLMHADYARFSREPPGQLVSRVTNDIYFVTNAGQQALNTLLRDVVSAICLVGYMIWIDWVLSLIILVVFPFTALPVILISRRLKRTAKRTQHELGDMTARLTEKLSGARLIKTFRLEDYASQKLNQSFEQVYNLRLKAVRQRARLGPMLEAFAGLAIAGVIALASWRISSGIASVGTFMSFMTCLLLAATNLRSLGNLTTGVQEGIAAAERMYELFDEPAHVIDRPGAKPLQIKAGAVRFENVSFSYENRPGTAAVHKFSLDVKGGTTVALVGRSGAGKSTIINLVPRLFDVSSGAILIDGQDLRDVTLDSLRAVISIVSQEVTLFDDTIRGNIALGRLDATEDQVVAAAKAAAAHDFIMAQPLGYATEIGDGGLRLSGGQRQRIALARAILKDAPILLLDEATSALDTQSERLVQDALGRFTKNRTTLVIAHRLSTVQRADLICVMDEGRIVELGTHADLMRRDGPYARLCRSQALEQDAASQAIN